jgi:hypothetical protein
MRDHWYYLLLGVPAAGLTFGIQYYLKKNNQSGASYGVHGEAPTAHVEPEQASEAETHSATETKLPDPKKIARRVSESPFRKVPSHILRDESVEQASAIDGVCRSIEYPGNGPVLSNYKKHEWELVLTQFREVKTSLMEWLERNREQLPPRTAALMMQQLERTKIQRPPSLEEPDLTWRGIGVWSQSFKGEPLIRLGGGMIRLAQKHPERARFELARLIAQSWAPCELKRLDAQASVWAPLAKCMGVQDSAASGDFSCEVGSYSEAGWAVSSALAAAVAAPGCALPAFQDAQVAQCVKQIPLPGAEQAALPEGKSGLKLAAARGELR